MNYQSFQSMLCACVQQILGSRVEVVVTRIRKNNNVQKSAMTFRSEESYVTPTIYFEDMFACYQAGSSVEEIAREISRVYQNSTRMNPWSMGLFSAYEQAKEHIYYRFINRKQNAELLKDVPYLPFLDLAIVCYYQIPDGPISGATTLLNKSNIEIWDVREERVFLHAFTNTPSKKTAVLHGMNDFLGQEGEEVMHVLTNEEGRFGAACLLYPDLLASLVQELGGNYYILPSSVHECIIVPDRGEGSQNGLQEIVEVMNRTHLEKTDILSDRVYYYDDAQGKIIY